MEFRQDVVLAAPGATDQATPVAAIGHRLLIRGPSLRVDVACPWEAFGLGLQIVGSCLGFRV